MPSRGVDELGGASSDPVFDGEEYASDYGLPVVVAEEADAEDKDVLSPWADDEDDGGAKESSKELGSGGGDVECPICGKFFKNDKALFGHLRSHPNRGYKGATPPEKKLKLSPEPASSSLPDIDGTSGQCSGRDPLLTPLEILCACFMLTLRCRDGSKAEAAQQAPPLPHRSFTEGKLDEKIDVGFGGGLVTTSDSGAAQVKTEDPGPETGNGLLCDQQHGSIDAIIPPKKRRRTTSKEDREASSSSKKVKVKLVTTTTTTPKEKRPYTCKHCKAEFSTNQALGGHMAGHHREKKAPPQALNTKETSSEHQSVVVQSQAIGGDEPSRAGLSLSSNRMQVEQLPSMAPNTGQAPRGRLKLHFVRRNRGTLPVATPGNCGDRRRPLNIDLNIEAPEQE